MPPQIADLPSGAALVWTAPAPDEDGYANEASAPEEGGEVDKPFDQNLKDLGARTYWVVPAGGTGAWTVVAQRPGLFVAVGARVIEARSTRLRKDIRRPPIPPQILDDGTKDWECGAPFPEGITLEVRGSGMVLRELGQKTEHPVIPAPKDFGDVENCVQKVQWWVEALGGLGRYLFLNHRTYLSQRSTQWHVHFVVFDLERMAPVEADLLPAGTGGWRAVVDDPSWRPELHTRLKKVIRETGAQVELDPAEVSLSHFWPVFPAAGADGLELAFRHTHDCFPCPALEVRRTLDALPPELLAWRKRHPAVDAVTVLLPKDRRVAGITVLDAPPERQKALQALFEAGRSGN